MMEWLLALALQPLLLLALLPLLAMARWLAMRLPANRLKRLLLFSWRV